ncbi:MAG TPA: ABC transporter permease [Spirochaetia bacterium]|nr:ABC transporter permease [Spirochaetia bacterium]
MNLSEGFRESWDMIIHNKLRTFLTMLGMNIGVAAVIAVMATGLMARAAVMTGVESIGTSLIWVRANMNAYEDRKSAVYMRPEDLNALADAAKGAWVSPLLRGRSTMGYHGYQDIANIYGVWPTYSRLWNVPTASGRFITEQDIERRNKVIVMGYNTAKLFFPDEANPVGNVVNLGSQAFTVVGIMAQRERSAIGDGSDDDTSYLPYETFANIYDWGPFGGVRVMAIYFKVQDIAQLDATAFQIGQYLYSKYGDYKGKPRFSVQKAEENINTFNKVFDVLTVVISLIAGISLLVGGIGIMNIMLVAVSERTREIGIRKAIGATRADILAQFLVEAIIICLVGGGIGIFVGLGVAYAVAALQRWVYVFPLIGVTLGVGVSMAIGLFFGIYPSMKAARLDPVVALTKE